MKLNMLLQNKAVFAYQTAHWTLKASFCNTQRGNISLMALFKSTLCCKVKSTFIRWGQTLLLWFSAPIFSLPVWVGAGCLCSSDQFYCTTCCICCRWWALQTSRGSLRKRCPCNRGGHPVYLGRWLRWGLRYLLNIFHNGSLCRVRTLHNPVFWVFLSTVNHCCTHVLAVFLYVCSVDVEAQLIIRDSRQRAERAGHHILHVTQEEVGSHLCLRWKLFTADVTHRHCHKAGWNKWTN